MNFISVNPSLRLSRKINYSVQRRMNCRSKSNMSTIQTDIRNEMCFNPKYLFKIRLSKKFNSSRERTHQSIRLNLFEIVSAYALLSSDHQNSEKKMKQLDKTRNISLIDSIKKKNFKVYFDIDPSILKNNKKKTRESAASENIEKLMFQQKYVDLLKIQLKVNPLRRKKHSSIFKNKI